MMMNAKTTKPNALNSWQKRLGLEFRKALRRAGNQGDFSNPLKRANLAKRIGISSEGLEKFSHGVGTISERQLCDLVAFLGDDEFRRACADFVCDGCGGIVGECSCDSDWK